MGVTTVVVLVRGLGLVVHSTILYLSINGWQTSVCVRVHVVCVSIIYVWAVVKEKQIQATFCSEKNVSVHDLKCIWIMYLLWLFPLTRTVSVTRKKQGYLGGMDPPHSLAVNTWSQHIQHANGERCKSWTAKIKIPEEQRFQNDWFNLDRKWEACTFVSSFIVVHTTKIIPNMSCFFSRCLCCSHWETVLLCFWVAVSVF